jgi:dipeptidase E
MRGGQRAYVIGNAVDFVPEPDRRAYAKTTYNPIAELKTVGIEAENLDLRDYFGNRPALRQKLDEVDLVWVLGGNAFLLRRAMALSGFDEVIMELLSADSLVYGGFSAGAVVAAPSLTGIEIMDDPTVLVPPYPAKAIWEGLGLIDFSIIPHYRSDHPEAPLAERAVRFLEKQGLPFAALRDGEVLIRDGGNVELLS